MSDPSTAILFVCMGNICRSPLAEGIFLHLAAERGVLDRFHVDSCGTGDWHVGAPADPRSIAVGAKYGIAVPSLARQVNPERDFDSFHWLIAMDRNNARHLLDLGAPRDRVHLMRSWDPEASSTVEDDLDVPDPYYGRGDGFEIVYTMLRRTCACYLDDLLSPEPRT